MLTLTLVIPVFNEEHQIKGCLDSIASQSVMPDEVIVVDNNCTDRTIEIARRFPFVTVITETKQGRGHARSAGFNAATGEIIGRIDADSRMDAQWVERAKTRFEKDSNLSGLTGVGKTTTLPFIEAFQTTLFSRSYYWFVHSAFRTITMWGATMAIRKSAWNLVAEKVINDDSRVHEDQDISLWIAANGGKIVQDNSVLIKTNGQTYRYLPKFIHYRKLFSQTKKIHTENGNLTRKIKLLSIKSTIFGRILSLFAGTYLILVSVIFFPLDYYMIHKLVNKEYLK